MTTPGDNPPPYEPPGGPGPGGYPPQRSEGFATPQQASNTPKVLGILGIICWVFCWLGAIAAIILGFIGQSKARQLGQPDTLPRIAWIGGICFLVLWTILGVIYRMR
ncbi:MAG: hypothetical protein J2P24_05370 [Streptosporangiales bacterium]|nr:hypothetical protein [Streptosporangiales bacterium]MBO0890093.1 hypothetical protein [Acidothermales bacterium]